MTTPAPLLPTRLQDLLAIPDLTQDPRHAIALMVDALQAGLESWPPILKIHGEPIVDARHNYTLLGYPPDAIVQDATYTHWIDDRRILRTQATALVLQSLIDLAAAPRPVVLLAPAMVYRRDVRDRWHCAQPHQVDIWVLLPKQEQTQQRLLSLVRDMAGAGIPGIALDIRPALHPYTTDGIEINARWQDQWLEVGEAGLIAPSLLDRLGIDPSRWGGLAMGLGVDRLVMIRKDLPDIRLLRDPLPAVARQMGSLAPWKTISRQPAAARELSLACTHGRSEEELVECVIQALQEDAQWLQTLEIKGRWPVQDLPPGSVSKLGARPGQENLLIRLTWQDPCGSLARPRVNALSARVYRSLHEGTQWEYCP